VTVALRCVVIHTPDGLSFHRHDIVIKAADDVRPCHW
jgi:hypothetical protein